MSKKTQGAKAKKNIAAGSRTTKAQPRATAKPKTLAAGASTSSTAASKPKRRA